MKRIIVFLVLVVAALPEIIAQQQIKSEMPDEQIVVNKKFNENGDLIGYDSTAVFTWKTDTTFNFGVPADSLSHLWNFPGIEQFMNEFWSDSVIGNPMLPRHPFTFGFRFSPFRGPLGSPNQQLFSDSLFADEFPFRFDSLFFNFGIDADQDIHHKFNQEFMEDFEERMNRFFFQDESAVFPNLKNEEQRKEWEQLMEKHRREMENLKKKWKD